MHAKENFQMTALKRLQMRFVIVKYKVDLNRQRFDMLSDISQIIESK